MYDVIGLIIYCLHLLYFIYIFLNRYIRLYKWSKLYSVWKYPEVKSANSKSMDGLTSGITGVNDEFFGLRMDDALSNIYLIRSLHRGMF